MLCRAVCSHELRPAPDSLTGEEQIQRISPGPYPSHLNVGSALGCEAMDFMFPWMHLLLGQIRFAVGG